MTENQRLKNIRENLGVDQKQFASVLDMQQGSLSDVERGRIGVSPKVLKKLEALGINPDYILSGKGPMCLFDFEEVYNLFTAQKLSEPTVKYNARPAIVSDNNYSNLYVIPIKAYGGFLAGYANKAYMDSLEKIPFPFVRGECFAFEIEGFSMVSDDPKEDSYPPGTWVITTEIESPTWCQKGKVYVFTTIDGIIIKEFVKLDDHYHLKSKNTSKEYKVQPIPAKSVKKIFHIEYKMAKPFY